MLLEELHNFLAGFVHICYIISIIQSLYLFSLSSRISGLAPLCFYTPMCLGFYRLKWSFCEVSYSVPVHLMGKSGSSGLDLQVGLYFLKMVGI